MAPQSATARKEVFFFFLVVLTSYDHGKRIRNDTHIGLEISFPASLRPALGLPSLISNHVIAFAAGCRGKWWSRPPWSCSMALQDMV